MEESGLGLKQPKGRQFKNKIKNKIKTENFTRLTVIFLFRRVAGSRAASSGPVGHAGLLSSRDGSELFSELVFAALNMFPVDKSRSQLW